MKALFLVFCLGLVSLQSMADCSIQKRSQMNGGMEYQVLDNQGTIITQCYNYDSCKYVIRSQQECRNEEAQNKKSCRAVNRSSWNGGGNFSIVDANNVEVTTCAGNYDVCSQVARTACQ